MRKVDYLIPAVTATCPRRLNQPVTQDAKAAFLGSDNIAAQKYGPPLVGCALQTSRMGISPKENEHREEKKLTAHR